MFRIIIYREITDKVTFLFVDSDHLRSRTARVQRSSRIYFFILANQIDYLIYNV